jgi:hypothetical protein
MSRNEKEVLKLDSFIWGTSLSIRACKEGLLDSKLMLDRERDSKMDFLPKGGGSLAANKQ